MDAWIDGRFVPEDQATVPLLSHSFSRGVAAFEVMDVALTDRGPAVFRLDAHVERFFESCRILHMPLELGKDDLARAVIETVRRNGTWPCAVKFFGYSPAVEYGLTPRRPRVSVAVFCYDPHAGSESKARGSAVTAGTSAVRKLSPATVAIHAKACGNYVSPFLAKWDAVQRGYDEVLMLDEAGYVAEGALANVFFVRAGKVRTPRLGKVLAGITRDSVMEVLRDLALEVAEADIPLQEALSADEAFFTGSVARVMPIRSIDGQPLGGDCPGPVTANVRAVLDDAYEGRRSEYDKWLAYVDPAAGAAP